MLLYNDEWQQLKYSMTWFLSRSMEIPKTQKGTKVVWKTIQKNRWFINGLTEQLIPFYCFP